MIYTIVVAVLALAILKFAAKLIAKIFGFILLVVAVILFLYHQGLGPFKQNHISIQDLEFKYCEVEQDIDKCDCIIKPIKTDIQSRFSKSEIEELERNRLKGAYILNKSLQAQKEEIAICLRKRDALDALEEFQQDLIPIDNEIIRKITGVFNTLQQKAQENWDNLKEDKDQIAKRY